MNNVEERWMMNMKRWMMTAVLGVAALFAVSANPVEWGQSGDASQQKNNAMESMKNDLLSAGKTALERIKSFVSFAPEQEQVNPAAKETLWIAAQHKAEESMEPVPADLAMAAELPQPIRKISGVLIHTDQESINKILRMKEYRGSG